MLGDIVLLAFEKILVLFSGHRKTAFLQLHKFFTTAQSVHNCTLKNSGHNISKQNDRRLKYFEIKWPRGQKIGSSTYFSTAAAAPSFSSLNEMALLSLQEAYSLSILMYAAPGLHLSVKQTNELSVC